MAWIRWLAIALTASLVILLVQARNRSVVAPPIPAQVVTDDGTVLMTGQDIREGRTIWRSIGGQEFGSVLGQGASIAPDWSAEWVHREASILLDHFSYDTYGLAFNELDAFQRERVRPQLLKELRSNTYDPVTRTLTISTLRAEIASQISRRFTSIFMDDPSAQKERRSYAMPLNAVKDPKRMALVNSFFFWAAWACVTDRYANAHVSYTENWPIDPLVGNSPRETFDAQNTWGLISFAVGIALCLAIFYSLRGRHFKAARQLDLPWREPTASMRATARYFWLVGALVVAQTVIGAVSSHPGLAGWFPSALSRSWYSQLGVMWSVTGALALALFTAPLISGVEPRRQCLYTQILFDAIVVVIVAALGIQSLAFVQRWGLESVVIGRFFLAFIGALALAGVGLVARALAPLWRVNHQARWIWLGGPLLAVLAVLTLALVTTMGAGVWASRWIEGAFRLIATGVGCAVFVRMGLLRGRLARALVLIAAGSFVVGTAFAPGSPLHLAFYALERLPLALAALDAGLRYYRTSSLSAVCEERWPVQFLIAASFWNLVGAHVTLIGLYGLMGLALLLLAFERLASAPLAHTWREPLISFSFWSINVGLLLRVFMGVLPADLMQAMALRSRGDWWARSAEFLQQPLITHFRSMRAVGDAVFLCGCFGVIWLIWRETHRGRIALPTARR